MKYKYSVVSGQTDPQGRYVRRPLVEVELSREAQSRKFLGLIDSGADQIIMPAVIAEIFGIDRTACPERSMMGITMESVPGFLGELTFHIEHQPESFAAPVVFLDVDDVPVLMGRDGFFDRYRIKFEQDHDTFEITPVRTR